MALLESPLAAAGAALPGSLSYGPPAASAVQPGAALPAAALPSGPSVPDGPRGSALQSPPSPLGLGGSASYNWSPYAPPAFTWGYFNLTLHFNSTAIGGVQNVVASQSGNVMLTLTGSWNPAPATSTDREWVMLISVFNGRASVSTLESNMSVRIAVSASQLPARFFFALPSASGFSGATSNARVDAVVPGSGLTRLNLTVASSGLNLASMGALLPIPTSSVWFNSSGNYTAVGYLNNTQNITVVAPLNGLPPFAVSEGQAMRWTGPGLFPGARFFLLANASSNANIGTRVSVWTRGSPESGLFINATAAPTNTSRGSNVTVSGVLGNRSLTASTNWSVEASAALPPNHVQENCTELIRLQNGSWRLFCNFRVPGANNTSTQGVDSAFSADGTSWAWEPGVRYDYCAGELEIDRITMYRLLDGRLFMLYTARNPQSCDDLPVTHVEVAISADEGWTWARAGDGGDVNDIALVPTPWGGVRYYYTAGPNVSTAYGDATTFAFDGLNISAPMPRAVYLLTDGSYKMYFGTTAVYSATSPNGIDWSAPRLEVANWSGDIEAGPLLDRGDGALTMLLYSQTGGLYLAHEAGGTGSPASLTVGGRFADGRALANLTTSSAGDGAFQVDAAIPDNAPLGRFRLTATAWFGGVPLAGNLLNRAPLWSGPSAITAYEDEPLTLDLAAWAVDPDRADTLTITASSPFGVLSGTNLTLNYPNGVLFDQVSGNFSDGMETVSFQFDVNVTPVDDLPTLALDPVYYFTEDQEGAINLSGRYYDEETPTAALVLSTDEAGGLVQEPLIWFNFSVPGTFPVVISVFDGANIVGAQTQFVVDPLDDWPVLSVAPRYNFIEDQPAVIDLTGAYSDEETSASLLLLTTNLSTATVAAPRVIINSSLPGTFDMLISVSDGNHTVAATTQVVVAVVDDAPIIDPLPAFVTAEDQPITIDFGAYVRDEDTPRGSLTLTTDLQGAAVSGLNVTVTLSDPRVWFFEVRVSDGQSTASRAAQINVTPVNDPPVWFGLPGSLQAVEGQLLRVNLSLYALDIDNGLGELTFSVTSPYARINGTFLELLYPDGVLSDSFTLRVSDGSLSDQRVVSVSVVPHNSLPVLVGQPPSELAPGSNVTFTFAGTDLETPAALVFALSTNVSWITLSPDGVLSMRPPLDAHGHFWYDVLLSDRDGGLARATFEVAVDNHAPIIGDFPRNARPNFPFSTTVPVFDPDGDPITVRLDSEVAAITIDPSTHVISWLPSYAYPPGTGLEVVVNITITASDGVAVTVLHTAIRVRDPADKAPLITSNFDDARGFSGQVFTYRLKEVASDLDDTEANLTWRVADDLPGSVAGWNFDVLTGILNVTLRGPGNGTLTVILSDPSGLSDTRTIHVQTLPPPPLALPASAGFPWWILLVVSGAGGAAVAVGRRRAVARAAARAGANGAVLAPPAAARSAPYLVENVFLLTLDGRPLFARTVAGAAPDEDHDILGSMLVAVQEFAKDAFKSGSPVNRMSYGDDTVLLERGTNAILAVTVFGEPSSALRETMTDVIGRVERAFAGLIEDWDGDRQGLAGLEDMLAPLWLGSQKVTREDVIRSTRGHGVEMLSAVEFFQGYVRVKIGIVNNTSQLINGATIDLDYNADALRLTRVEPPTYRSAGSRVMVGAVGRGEKVAVAYYLDPQICTVSAIDATCVYKDLEGAQHVVEMKSRRAEIVCPLFFTKEQANTALLKRLIETKLDQYDARGYALKAGTSETDLQRLYEFMKSAALAHEIQLVRSHEKRHPYAAEAWLYGRTKAKGLQMVIRVAVNASKGRAEFFVASTAMPPVTGLLAELHHSLMVRASNAADGVSVQPLFDESLRREYEDRRAISKVLESEAEPSESEGGPAA